MGVTLHYKLGQKKQEVKKTLDRAQYLAEIYKAQGEKIAVLVEIRRLSDYRLYIDIGNCETLAFDFKSVAEIMEAGSKDWDYMHAVLTDDGKKKLDEGYEITKYPQNEKYYSAECCKTQFSHSLAEHRFVAEIVRSVASYCIAAEVSDEGDYYYSGEINDAKEAIQENGALITSIAGQLKQAGWDN